MKFNELSLNEKLLKAIEETGYTQCTAVQEQVVRAALLGKDLYVQSQTGTGKTAAYLIPVFQRLLEDSSAKGKKALIMVPTRELAVQVEEEAKSLSQGLDFVCGSFYGGVGYQKQEKLLKKGTDVIIGTPGRVIDLHDRKLMNLSEVAVLVIDEADRMFDMGFYPDLRKLIKFLPEAKKRQTMLFSATLNTMVKNLAWEYTLDPEEITIESENITVSEIDQELFHVSSDDRMKLLLGILKNENPETVIIFCNTKKKCEIISKRLVLNGIQSEFIIGDLPQKKRLQVINDFKQGKIRCLVATDVAARGIDVSDLSMVINYELPNEAENYVHRIGRTARAGKSGKAYSFCCEQDVYNLPAVERYIEIKIPAQVATEDLFEEDKSKGVYIKLDNYDDQEEDSGRENRRQRNSGNNYRRGSGSSRRNQRSGNERKPAQNAGRDRYGNRKNTTAQTGEKYTQDLSNLSFEERMEVYKKKYGGKSASGKKNYTKPQNKKYTKKQKQYGNREQNGEKPKTSKKPSKGILKTLFGKIFGGKK